MNELTLYDQQEGLFRRILERSTVIEGRYFIMPRSIDFSSIVKEAPNEAKYPCVLCLPPRTVYTPDGGTRTHLFTLFFLTRSGHTGQGAVKAPNPATLKSEHHTWYDWKDMAECADNFLDLLRRTIKSNHLKYLNLNGDNVGVDRVSDATVDAVNGVRVTFSMSMIRGCDNSDYADVDPATIQVCENIHPLHKH